MAPNIAPFASEVARQQACLADLPEGYTFPLFNTKQALLSQRSTGYRTTAVAAREIVDNSIEAGAKRVDILLERPKRGDLQKHERADRVKNVYFVDNGSGMVPQMIRYALSWGGGTHFDDHEFIGKFGFGLPNASINQTRKVSVYSKTIDEDKIYCVNLDIDEYQDFGRQDIPDAEPAELPTFVKKHLKSIGEEFKQGTVVVWHEPDQLSLSTAGSLREHILDDFGATYRNFLDEVDVYVDGKKIDSVDPLFLTPDSKYYVDPDEGGAILKHDRTIPVRYVKMKENGSKQFFQMESEDDPGDEAYDILAEGVVRLRVARFPYEFAKYTKAKSRKNWTDANHRFDIRKDRRGMCFVRAGREIETVDVFPRNANQKASGMGDWPLLQAYAYHWGIEVSFTPELDDAFGITNDKQTVRPSEDFWKMLSKLEVDQWLRAENKWQNDTRREERKKKQEAERSEEEPSGAEAAASRVENISGKPTKPGPADQDQVDDETDQAAEEEAEKTGQNKKDVLKALKAERKRRPFKIEFFEDSRAPFYLTKWGKAGQILVQINKAHPFYSSLYLNATSSEHGTLARDGLEVLLFAFAKAELTVETEDARMFYEQHREEYWSPFLSKVLRILDQSPDADNDVDEDTETDAA